MHWVLRVSVAFVWIALTVFSSAAWAGGVTLRSAFGNNGPYDQPIVLIAELSAVSQNPSGGSCQLFREGVLVDTQGFPYASAVFTSFATLAIGTYRFSARCIDSAGNVTTSNVVVYEVTKASPGLYVDFTKTTGYFGETAEIGVNVISSRQVDMGPIELYDGTTLIGSATVGPRYGALTFKINGLAIGPHTLTAHYGGDALFFEETSGPLIFTILPARMATTTVVTVSPNPVNLFENVSLSASVTSASGLPNGTIYFFDASTEPPRFLTNSLVVNGLAKADYYTGVWGSGLLKIQAVFKGDQNFQDSTSLPTPLRVGAPEATSIVLSSSVNPSDVGEAVTFTVNVQGLTTGPVSEGTAILFSNGMETGRSAVINGQAVFAGIPLVSGFNDIQAKFLPSHSYDYQSSQSEILRQQVASATQTTLQILPNPASAGEPLTINVSVTSSAGSPSGVADVSVEGQLIQTIPIANGQGQFVLPPFVIPVGQTPGVVASFRGSDSLLPSASDPLVVTISKRQTTTVLSLAPSDVPAGSPVTLTAVVNDSGAPPRGFPGALPLTGHVDFYQDRVLLGSGTINNGVATFVTQALPPDTTVFSAQYVGDEIYLPSGTAGTSLTVKPLKATVSLTSSKNPSVFGDVVILTVTATDSEGRPSIPTGDILFSGLANSVLPVRLVNGTATIEVADFTTGTHRITAALLGSNYYLGLTAAPPLVQVVNALTTSTTLTSSANPSVYGQDVTFTVNVTSGKGVPTGDVTFFDGTIALGTFALVNGQASVSMKSLTLGQHSIRASFAGSANFEASTSAILLQSVDAPPESAFMDEAQDKGSRVVAQTSTEFMTDSVGDEIDLAFGGTPTSFNIDGQSQALNIGVDLGQPISGPRVEPTADVPDAGVRWRLWTRLKYTDWRGGDLSGNQVNGLLGLSARLYPSMVAGVLTGYETFGYKTDKGATFDGDGYSLGGYVAKHFNTSSRVDLQAIGSLLNYDVAAGAFNGDLDAKRFTLSGGFVHRFDFGETLLEPNLRASSVWEWQDEYVDSATVYHPDRNFYYGRLAGGAKLSHRFILDESSFTPYLSFSGEYRFSSRDLSPDQSLDGLSARLGVGASFATQGGATLGLDGELSGLGLKSGKLSRSIKAQFNLPF